MIESLMNDSQNIIRTLTSAHYIHHVINLNKIVSDYRKDQEIIRRYTHTYGRICSDKNVDYRLTKYRALASRIKMLGF